MSEPAAGPGPEPAIDPVSGLPPQRLAYRNLKKRFKLPRRLRRPLLWLAFAAGGAVVAYECWVAGGVLLGSTA